LEGERKGLLEGERKGLLKMLRSRFGDGVSEADAQQIATLTQAQLDRLYPVAIGCPDLAAFRAALAMEIAPPS
jgi:hypothetical protein